MDIISELNKIDFFSSSNRYSKFNDAAVSHGFEIDKKCIFDVHSVHQIHGNKVIRLDELLTRNTKKQIEADGIYSNLPGEAVGIKTADCLPVLFHHKKAVAATHAGWRGLSQNILTRTLHQFDADDIGASDVSVLIGPAISASSFEVGPEVIDAFEEYSKEIGRDAFFTCLSKGVSDRWYLDLQLLAAFECISKGVMAGNISIMRTCTLLDSYWHSYRRSGKAAGRIISWIRL